MPLAAAIAGSSGGAYFAPMLAAILRLLAVAALALMPFGMAAASAGPAHHAPTASSAGHCDDESGAPSRESQNSLPGCAAGCAMFMAEQVSAEVPIMTASQSNAPPIASRWSSLPPETATPPPKLA